MIRKKIFLLGLLFCVSIALTAQRATYISIDGNTVPVDNLLMQDSVVGGRINYFTSFTMPVNDDPAGQYILNALQKGNANVAVFYTRAAATTQRQYSSVNALQIQVAKLDAAGKNSVKMEVKLRSLQVTEQSNVKLDYKTNMPRAVLNGNFLVAIDNLPTANISSVTGLELKNNSLVSFEIAVRDIDAWSKSFNTVGKKFNGSITLIAPNMRDKIKQFKLSGIELVSLTQSINGAGDRIERFTVVAKVGTVSMEDAK